MKNRLRCGWRGFKSNRRKEGGCRIILKEHVNALPVKVTSLSGHTVYSGKIQGQETRIALPTGFYIITATFGGQTKQFKFISK